MGSSAMTRFHSAHGNEEELLPQCKQLEDKEKKTHCGYLLCHTTVSLKVESSLAHFLHFFFFVLNNVTFFYVPSGTTSKTAPESEDARPIKASTSSSLH